MELILITTIGFITAFLGSFISGGLSLLTMPLLLLTGMPSLATSYQKPFLEILNTTTPTRAATELDRFISSLQNKNNI